LPGTVILPISASQVVRITCGSCWRPINQDFEKASDLGKA
jgi:hypothetical protein